MFALSSRRRSPRAPANLSVRVTLGARQMSGKVWQLSEGGLLLELTELPTAPMALAVAFDLPGQGGHRVVVEPRWSSASPPRFAPAAGKVVGCRFTDITPATSVAVASYVRKVKQQYEQVQLALALVPPPPRLRTLVADLGLTSLRDQAQLKERVALVMSQLHATP